MAKAVSRVDDRRLTIWRLFLILRRLRALLQHLAVPDGAFAGVAGQLKILGKLQRIGGTSVLAQTAKHAAAEVVGKVGEFLAAGVLISFAFEHNQDFPV